MPHLNACYYDRDDPQYVILMDNTSMHISDEVVDVITCTGGPLVIYSSPYSPHLNPIKGIVFKHWG